MTYYKITDNIKTLEGQLVWITGQTRPDLGFEVCQLSSILNHEQSRYFKS